MKKLIISIIILSCMSGQAYSRGKSSFGARAGLAIPVAGLMDICGPGVHFGFIARVATSNPQLWFAMGGGASFMSSKWQGHPLGGSYETDYDPISFFAGLHAGKEKGMYFLPAVALNSGDGDSRVGIDMSVGVQKPVSDGGLRADIGIKLSILNIFMKESGEDMNALVTAFVGVAF